MFIYLNGRKRERYTERLGTRVCSLISQMYTAWEWNLDVSQHVEGWNVVILRDILTPRVFEGRDLLCLTCFYSQCLINSARKNESLI